MAITGYLSEFSLAELFQFLDQGHKTGLLSIRNLPNPHSGTMQSHYIWFSQGRIMGAANQLDHKGLLTLISKRGWLSERVIARIVRVCSINMPIGLYLKSQGLLQAEQLKILFSVQVLRQVCALFALQDGYFQFDGHAPLPMAEMTGLSTPASEVTLAGLRALRDWTKLADKLPEPTSALVNCSEGKPNVRIDQQEWQVWEFTNGTISMAEIAEHLRLPVEKVQQIAFRLIVVGLVEEVPMIISAPPLAALEEDGSTTVALDTERSGVSQSFLQNLVGFLRNKV